MHDHLIDMQWYPGPSDEARRLQLRQEWALEAYWDIRQSDNSRYESVEAQQTAATLAWNLYLCTVQQLLDLLGPDASAHQVDQDLWSSFSDCYKSETGVRPHFHISRNEVLAWFDDAEARAGIEQQRIQAERIQRKLARKKERMRHVQA